MLRQSSEEVILAELEATPAKTDVLPPRRPQVVILGAGFGGLNAALGLRNAPVDITVVDRRNYHLFQPLLYQVATAGISPAQIAMPIRRVLASQKNATVLMEKVEGVDTAARIVLTGSRRIPYDYLIIATGARHAYFGHDAWEANAPGLKTIGDATEIRARILTAFEKAEVTDDPALREKLLTFVVVGGGPTGVELAGAIIELARKAIVRDFRNIDSSTARVVLVEADERLLTAFPEKLSQSAKSQIEKLGVEVKLGAAVTECDDNGVALADGQRVASACVLWAAGVMASRAAKWLDVAADRAGRVVVDGHLHVPGREGVYVIGDTASVKGKDGRPVPGLAPAAKQMGRYVADLIKARLAGGTAEPFRYADYGNLATIGRKAAVADLGPIQLSGFLAWLLWSFAHLWFLVGFRNRTVVFLDWAWAYATFDRTARLITERRDR
ncbi:NAD(P)/FAD-dependent oxidoreductase [Mesorhizobium sp.]|uniref:NAD(P)/FAD-dependent oxidoreductase n=1 Tax=Mesorhizobium sp. TaxID=1871066 RepID=UPI000FE6CC18|nr:NAD(P)/FAD-dependent oxidoreductase [Mesorhizobium sp.]RWB94463.1 MAG: NAD(P)/FAD-dependent oxidoreductase [Mesorhizobium sp.]RWO14904.1 MAG: NAD(P)/FAD-dependent oxidoreductase [Mesorhizobium sp.]RWP24046.1 MAG: NAD(P)/FAD-dependent oxidoreductase [Mesorhizobium sp.]RWP58208.1 MAG: NAD(P)/FAD-dependent oxidoreductase [Mesorhizobium sp.]RWQ45899.1 MAG: NAD(P)/FAD-dependent oxidoreductase [Mesorhizobium sp.]